MVSGRGSGSSGQCVVPTEVGLERFGAVQIGLHFGEVSSSSGQSLLLVDGGPSGLEQFSVPFLSVCASSGQILLLVGGELPIATQ